MTKFMKICPLGAGFIDADGRTGMTKLIVTFRTFVKSPNKGNVNTAEGSEQLPTPVSSGQFELRAVRYQALSSTTAC